MSHRGYSDFTLRTHRLLSGRKTLRECVSNTSVHLRWYDWIEKGKTEGARERERALKRVKKKEPGDTVRIEMRRRRSPLGWLLCPEYKRCFPANISCCLQAQIRSGRRHPRFFKTSPQGGISIHSLAYKPEMGRNDKKLLSRRAMAGVLRGETYSRRGNHSKSVRRG